MVGDIFIFQILFFYSHLSLFLEKPTLNFDTLVSECENFCSKVEDVVIWFYCCSEGLLADTEMYQLKEDGSSDDLIWLSARKVFCA